MDYRKAYFRLFGAVSKACILLENDDSKSALALLIAAQLEAEEDYINSKDGLGIAFPRPPKDE